MVKLAKINEAGLRAVLGYVLFSVVLLGVNWDVLGGPFATLVLSGWSFIGLGILGRYASEKFEKHGVDNVITRNLALFMPLIMMPML